MSMERARGRDGKETMTLRTRISSFYAILLIAGVVLVSAISSLADHELPA